MSFSSPIRSWVFEVSSRIKNLSMDQQSEIIDPTSAPLRMEQLQVFSEEFCILMEVISDGARYGPTLGLEHRYSQLSQSLSSSFAPCKPFIFAYVDPTVLSLHSVEQLWKHEDLKSLLDSDDSNLMFLMNQSLDAIQLYESHLRYLLEKTA